MFGYDFVLTRLIGTSAKYNLEKYEFQISTKSYKYTKNVRKTMQTWRSAF